MQFLLDNIVLIIIAVIAVVGLAMPYISARRFGPQVDAQTAVQLINKQNALVIDVRPVKDFAKGHIARSINMPADEIQRRLNELSKSRPIIVVDQTGCFRKELHACSAALVSSRFLSWRQACLAGNVTKCP